MPTSRTVEVMILVKAAPVLTSHLTETMCVAAMSLGPDPRWVRLHPVPFRDLDDESKFRKYQTVTADVIRSKTDRRPESWTPLEGTLRLAATVGTEHGWSTRRERVESLGEHTMCDLIQRNRSGSGPNTPSLAVVRVADRPELLISKRDKEQLDKWRQRAEAIDAQPSLFDDPERPRQSFEIIPWRFRYRYRCLADGCKGHAQTIVDWEAVALYRKVRDQPDWQDLMTRKFVEELWADSSDSSLFVGNMENRPWNFLVLGVFWPPRSGLQTALQF